jgi:hypothetical protein
MWFLSVTVVILCNVYCTYILVVSVVMFAVYVNLAVIFVIYMLAKFDQIR